MTDQIWHVTVSVNGEDVLTIGHNSLSGVDNVEQYRKQILNAAEHLIAFIGKPADMLAEMRTAVNGIWTFDSLTIDNGELFFQEYFETVDGMESHDIAWDLRTMLCGQFEGTPYELVDIQSDNDTVWGNVIVRAANA